MKGRPGKFSGPQSRKERRFLSRDSWLGPGNYGARRLLARGFETGGHQELSEFGPGANQLDFHRGQALIVEVEGVGRCAGEVDDPVFGNRTAVVDRDDNRLVIAQVGDR